MFFPSIILKICSLFLNFFTLFTQLLEDIALKFRFNKCDCCYPIRLKSQNGYCLRSNKGKKRTRGQYSPVSKTNGTSASTTVEHYSYGSEVKRIKLLLDITMSEGTQPQVLNIHASAAHDDRYNTCSEHCEKKQWFFWKLINLPSSIVLYGTSKLRNLMYFLESVLDLEHEEDHHHVEDSNRIKKSPKRRISRANYRRIIPFFPFNLLGFSNYTAFQMPSITRSSDETNNLNVSINGNGKTRSKRRRHSSTDASSISDNDNSKVLGETSGATLNGHDEVDSDETADTITKQVSSSSSSSDPSSSTKFVIVPNCEETSTTADSDSKDIVGDEQVVSSFLQELDEASNEAYLSDEDPDYKPAVGSTTEDSSFNTDSCASEESFLAEMGGSVTTTSSVEAAPASVPSKPVEGPVPEPDCVPTSTMNPTNLDIGSVSTGCDDDYKTPAEEEDDTQRLKQFAERS